MFGGDQALHDMYMTNFTLMQEHKYSLTELDNMLPFEREIYVTMLTSLMEKRKMEADKARTAAAAKQAAQMKKLQQKRR